MTWSNNVQLVKYLKNKTFTKLLKMILIPSVQKVTMHLWPKHTLYMYLSHSDD